MNCIFCQSICKKHLTDKFNINYYHCAPCYHKNFDKFAFGILNDTMIYLYIYYSKENLEISFDETHGSEHHLEIFSKENYISFTSPKLHLVRDNITAEYIKNFAKKYLLLI